MFLVVIFICILLNFIKITSVNTIIDINISSAFLFYLFSLILILKRLEYYYSLL